MDDMYMSQKHIPISLTSWNKSSIPSCTNQKASNHLNKKVVRQQKGTMTIWNGNDYELPM